MFALLVICAAPIIIFLGGVFIAIYILYLS
jgi:hypothetical protein